MTVCAGKVTEASGLHPDEALQQKHQHERRD